MAEYIKREEAMDVREKLVEILRKPIFPHELVDPTEAVADYLLDSGVTVQEWISVKDRLPDLIPCNAGTAYSEAVIIWTSGRKAMIAVWDGIDWIAPFDYWEAWGEEITHWMPLPHPPKGE